MIIEPMAEELEDLLKQIQNQIARARGQLIFRGENKNYGKITSKLYRYFNSIMVQAKRQKDRTAIDFQPVRRALEAQLRGLGENVNYNDLMKNLTENVYAQLSQKEDEWPLVERIQKEFILNDVREYIHFEKEVDILTQLQHYGGSTNLIDFSHDVAVALFFACDGERRENGRLILLDAKDPDIQPPKKNQNNRVVFQKSVFVQREYGYIEENEVKEIIISKGLKQKVLSYVQDHYNIKPETIYGDLAGYIQNQERHREAYKEFFTGLGYRGRNAFQEEVRCYGRAIKIKPNFLEAYKHRGIANCDEGLRNMALIHKAGDSNDANYPVRRYYRRAIRDYTRGLELNSEDFHLYNNRGYAHKVICDYEHLFGDPRHVGYNYRRAVRDYNSAIRYGPDFIKAYVNLAECIMNRGQFKEARKNLEIASRLMEEQGDDEAAGHIDELMAVISKSLDS